ncbi:hypothetical protein B0T18DRAFT_411921 [Schizothecium vesticola]|uniref:EamA domain-containing protein n=1 Tax=Schizothecium vesticola TaxID=314040 RepID=A0AA40K5S8_9PEZI|nr:hypothetical protein B0T18DRAFT_411921 [Schizothecium vesticola]
MPTGSRQRRAARPAADKPRTNPHPSKAPSPPASSVTSAVSTSTSSHLKGRVPRQAGNSMSDAVDELMPLLDVETTTQPESTSRMGATTWIGLALASGACAAFNGVFAKLTTTQLTTTLSQGIADFLGLSSIEAGIEVAVRCMFFGLNLLFNGIMWTLFTKALTRGHSTAQVSIVNTSSNFFITAILGFAIFSEALPPLWWLGAAMLVAGNVIIGRKDEGSKVEGAVGGENDAVATTLAPDGHGSYHQVPSDGHKDDDEDILDLELDELSET